MKMPSRIRGSRNRACMVTNNPSSARPLSPAVSVEAEVHPASGARTTANTTAASPAVTVAALVRSREPRRVTPAGITERVTATTTAARGTLMKNTQGHEAYWVRTPPRKTPAVPPAGAAAPYSANALVSSFGEDPKVMNSSVRAAGAISADPAPWTARPASSTGTLPANPAISEPTARTTQPRVKMRRAPNRSESRPPRSSRPPNATT